MPVTVGAVAAGAQALGGLYQQYRAGRLRKKAQKMLEQNPYEIPTSQTAYVNRMGQLAQGTKLPGQEQMETGIKSRTASTINAARQATTSPSQVLASTLASYAQQQQANQALELQAAEQYRNRQSQYAQAIATLAPFEQKRWEYRTLYPAQSLFNAAGASSQAGQQNMAQGIQSGIGLYANQQYLNSLKGSGSGAALPTTATIPSPVNFSFNPSQYYSQQVTGGGVQQRLYNPPTYDPYATQNTYQY